MSAVVYFVRAANGLIKIGTAGKFAIRFRGLQLQSPLPVECLATVPGASWLERRFHARFIDSRSHGEWFHPIPDLIAMIADIVADAFDVETLPPPKRIGRVEELPRNLAYITEAFRYKSSVLQQLRHLKERGAPIQYNEFSLGHSILAADEAGLRLLRQELDPQIAALVAKYPSATTLRRQRKVPA